MDNRITDKHRLFVVNGKLEFALFYDPKVTDKEAIVNSFLESKEWKFYKCVWDVKKVIETKVSNDLKRVDIKVS